MMAMALAIPFGILASTSTATEISQNCSCDDFCQRKCAFIGPELSPRWQNISLYRFFPNVTSGLAGKNTGCVVCHILLLWHKLTQLQRKRLFTTRRLHWNPANRIQCIGIMPTVSNALESYMPITNIQCIGIMPIVSNALESCQS